MDISHKVWSTKEVHCRSITELPKELQIEVLNKLGMEELVSMRKVSKHFAELIEGAYPSLIKDISLQSVFPDFTSAQNMNFFSRLSSSGNLEATIKLGIAHLYHEGLTDTATSRQKSSLKAVEYFSGMEKSSELKSPVTWVLIRPPWSSAAVCRKAYVVKNLIKMTEEPDCHPRIMYCIGKVFHLFEDDENKRQSARIWMKRAADAGLPDAKYELWKMDLKFLNERSSVEAIISTCEPGLQLNLVRQLRKVAGTGYHPAQVQLCRLYAMGYHGGLSTYGTTKFIKGVFQKSNPTTTKHLTDAQSRMNGDMRFILIDWLIEVATLKNFSSESLHAATQCMDSFLRLRESSRSYLQLLGIACMVLCTRYIEKDVLTIREAVWLTDSAYKYEELVRMIEDVVSALKGNIKKPSICDYLSIFLNFSDISKDTKELAKFLADLSLLYEDVTMHSPAKVAAACLLLANLTSNTANPWSAKMVEFTGLSKRDIAQTVTAIHKGSISRQFLPEYGKLEFTCIEERFSQTSIGPIKLSQIVSLENLTAFLESDTCNDVGEDKHCAITVSDFSQISECKDELIKSSIESYSSEDEFENDTPPTFSCAYLVKPDTKTRKRIRMNNAFQPSTSGSSLKENDSKNAGTPIEMSDSGSSGKSFPAKASKKKHLSVRNDSKSRSLSPRAFAVSDKENSHLVCQRKSSGKLCRSTTSSPCSSKSMKSMR